MINNLAQINNTFALLKENISEVEPNIQKHSKVAFNLEKIE